MEEYIQQMLISFLIALLPIVLYVLIFAPRYIIKIKNKYLFFSSNFQSRKYVDLGEDLLASYAEKGNISTNDASVLLVHGFSGSSSYFIEFSNKLPENYHVVAVDLLNHGESSSITEKEVSVDDMVNFLEKFIQKSGLSERKFHIISFSYGTTVCFQYASLFPERVASLVVCSAPHFLDLSGAPKGKFSCNEEFIAFSKTVYGSKYQCPSNLVVRALVDECNKSMERYQPVQDGQRVFKFTEQMLSSIKANTLLVWGDADKVCLFKGIDHFKANIPNCACYVIKDGGHFIFETHLEEVSKAIIEWLSSQREIPVS